MFEAEINVGRLIECIEPITAISDEAVLNIVADGWNVKVVDPANVTMLSLELQSDTFDKFEFGVKPSSALFAEGGIKIGLDFGNLLGMLRLWEWKKVELKLDEHAEKLFVKSDIFDYSISLIKRSSLRREPKIPETDFPVQVIVETEEFKRAIRAMERLSDVVLLGGEPFYMEVKDERNVLRSVLRKGSAPKKEPSQFHSAYSLKYISAMCKGMIQTSCNYCFKAQNLTLNFGMDSPLQIDFEVGAAGKEKVSYFLAPRIE